MTGVLRDLVLGVGLVAHCARTRAATGAWPAGWRDRDGDVGSVPRRAPGPRVLVHGVSVGETNALAPFVDALAASPCEPDVVVSAATETGFARAGQLHGRRREVVRFPLDFTWTARRFLDAVRPRLVALGELELWPTLVTECARRGVPVCVVNGRLSARSYRGYRAGRLLVRRLFAGLSFVAAQTETYRRRFVAMGVPPDRAVATGSLKWDAALRAPDPEAAERLATALGIDRTRPLVVAGSTGPGEERRLLEDLPAGCQLLLAPRDPNRWDEVAALRPGIARRSRCPEAGSDSSRNGGVFLLDTLGELADAYLLADAVFVGRTLAPMGGSNPLEPLALGKPAVVGPHWEHFEGVVQELLDTGGVAVSGDPMRVIGEWLAEPAAAEAVAAGARRAFEKNRGSSARTAEMALKLLQPEGRPPGPGEP